MARGRRVKSAAERCQIRRTKAASRLARTVLAGSPMLTAMKDRMMSAARSPNAERALFAISFATKLAAAYLGGRMASRRD